MSGARASLRTRVTSLLPCRGSRTIAFCRYCFWPQQWFSFISGAEVTRPEDSCSRFVATLSPTFALKWHFRSWRQKIPFAFNAGTAKIGENSLGEDLASFLRKPTLACCCLSYVSAQHKPA